MVDTANPDHARGLCEAQTVYSRLMAAAAVAAATLPAALLAFLPAVDAAAARPELFWPGVATLLLGVARCGPRIEPGSLLS